MLVSANCVFIFLSQREDLYFEKQNWEANQMLKKTEKKKVLMINSCFSHALKLQKDRREGGVKAKQKPQK